MGPKVPLFRSTKHTGESPIHFESLSLACRVSMWNPPPVGIENVPHLRSHPSLYLSSRSFPGTTLHVLPKLKNGLWKRFPNEVPKIGTVAASSISSYLVLLSAKRYVYFEITKITAYETTPFFRSPHISNFNRATLFYRWSVNSKQLPVETLLLVAREERSIFERWVRLLFERNLFVRFHVFLLF